MKTIKNIMLAAMVLFAGNAMAQKLSAEAVTFADGVGSLVVNFEGEDMTGAQFNLELPAGVTITYDDEEDDFVFKAQKGYNVNFNDGANAQTKIVIISRKNKNIAALTSGTALITIGLTAESSFTSGNAKISAITFAKSGASVDGNADFEVALSLSTGIESLNAEDSNEPAFNLAGQKVSKNYKGIIVKNGKKVMK